MRYGIVSGDRAGAFLCLFLDLYFLGTGLIQGDLFFILFAIVAAAGIHIQIRQEERFLEAHYGEAYRRYRRAVPRYVKFRLVSIPEREPVRHIHKRKER